MTIEFTVDHDHTYAAEGGFEQLIGWITFSMSTYPGDFRVRDLGAGMPRTINLPSRRGWLAADGHLYQDQTLAAPCRLVANDPAFNLRHLTYRADFALTTVAGDPIAVPHTFFPAPSTDTTLPLTKVMTDPYQPVMEVRSKIYAEDILDAGDFGQDVVFAGTASEFWDLAGTVPSTSLPSYVDDVLSFTNQAAFPAEGETGKIYLALDTGDNFRWATGDPGQYVRISDRITAAGITDSTALGRSLVTASSQAVARLALGPGVFDARDYGVVADGQPHNNVANLLDCFSAAYAAGASEVVLPSGVIDTSDAVLGTVTADSGATYYNNGCIPLPVNQAIAITGHGRRVTTLKLSPGFEQAFAAINTSGSIFQQIVDDYSTPKTFRDITISKMTIDRDNVTGSDQGPVYVVPSDVTLTNSAGTTAWVTIPSVTASNYRNCRNLYFYPENTANGGYGALTASNWRTYRRAIRVSGSSLQISMSAGESIALKAGNKFQGSMRSSVLLGLVAGYSNAQWNVNLASVLIEEIDVVNVAEDGFFTDGSGNYASTGTRRTLSFNTPRADEAYIVNAHTQNVSYSGQLSITDITLSDIRAYGGSYGFCFQAPTGTWIDNVWAIDCYHDTLIPPDGVSNWNSVNFHFGSTAWLGSGGAIRCVGKNSGDVAIEIDQPWEFWEEDCHWEDAVNCSFRTTFTPPARTSAGPLTTNLSGSLTSNATTCTVNSTPPDRSGLALIDSELVWYQASGYDSTTWEIWRGINGSTAASHASSAKVTFVETSKTKIHSNRNTITSNNQNGVCVATITSSNLPVPPITLRDCQFLVKGGAKDGRVMSVSGWCPDVDIQGLNITYNRFSSSNSPSDAKSAISISAGLAAGKSLYNALNGANRAPIPAPRIYGRNNRVQTHGVAGWAVRASSTGSNISLSSPGASLDGISLSSGDLILLKDQTTASQNGVYVWNGASSALTPKATGQQVCLVKYGTANSGKVYSLTSAGVASTQTNWASNVSYSALRIWDGYWDLDFDIDAEMSIANSRCFGAYLQNWGSYSGNLTIAPNSRLGVTISSPGDTNTPATTGVYVGDTYVTVLPTLSLDVDASGLKYDSSDTPSYSTWLIDAGAKANVKINSVKNPVGASLSVVTANYTVLPWTELVMVDTTSGPVTLTLPSTTVGGYSLLGEPLSRGWQLQIIDAGRNARNNPITITPASTDRISGGTAGESMQLDDNGQQVTLIAYPGLPGWISSQPVDNLDGTATM